MSPLWACSSIGTVGMSPLWAFSSIRTVGMYPLWAYSSIGTVGMSPLWACSSIGTVGMSPLWAYSSIRTMGMCPLWACSSIGTVGIQLYRVCGHVFRLGNCKRTVVMLAENAAGIVVMSLPWASPLQCLHQSVSLSGIQRPGSGDGGGCVVCLFVFQQKPRKNNYHNSKRSNCIKSNSNSNN